MKKKWLSYLLDISVIFFLLLALSMFAFGQEASPSSDEPVKQKVSTLKKDLKLNDVQAAEVVNILVMSGKQAHKDRDTFKADAVALVSAARQRRARERLLINNLLSPEQKEIYKKSQQMSQMERELFMLTEGLLLNPDQAFTVEGILIEHYERFRDFMPQGGMGAAMRPRSGNMRRGMGRMRSFMKSVNANKNKAIKKVLTKPQKTLFKQLQKDIEKKRSKRIKEMRSRR